MPVWQWLASSALPAEFYEEKFRGWRVLYHYVEGKPAAAALMKGTEIHFVIAPEWRNRGITRLRAREFIGRAFDVVGQQLLTTRILEGRESAERFVRRMGFEETWRDETFIYFALTDLPFQRGKK